MRSPHRHRGDALEAWRVLLFGEVLRALGPRVSQLTVRRDESVKLPRSGRWELGLARLRPALDDVLGHTALAIAWRWACAEVDANAWPSLELVARKAIDARFEVAEIETLATFDGGSIEARKVPGARFWRLETAHGESVVSVSGAVEVDWSEVDRLADIAAVWLDGEWSQDVSLPVR